MRKGIFYGSFAINLSESIESSDASLALCARYRAAILHELSVRYGETIGEKEGATRIGVLLCLLHEIRVISFDLVFTFLL